MIRPAATRLGSNAYTSRPGSAAANGNVVSPSCAPTSIQMRRYVRARASRPNVSLSARRRSLRMNVVTPSQRVDEPAASPILTIFSAPKAFSGHVGIIQENAIRSWLSLKPTPKIILFGDDAATAGFARGLGGGRRRGRIRERRHHPDPAQHRGGADRQAVVAALPPGRPAPRRRHPEADGIRSRVGGAVGRGCRRRRQIAFARRHRLVCLPSRAVRGHAPLRDRQDVIRQLAVVAHRRVGRAFDRRHVIRDPDSPEPRLLACDRRRLGRRRGSREPPVDPALDELLPDHPCDLDAASRRHGRASIRVEVPPGAAEAARQPCAAGHPADQDAPSNLATHPALRGVIDFLRRLPARLLSGRLLIRRAFGLSAGRGVASVLSAAWVIVIARRLSVDQFGEVSVALALVLIFSTVSDLGLQNILARDVVETGRIRRAVLDAVVARRLVLAAISVVLLVVLFVIATHDRNLAVPIVFGLSIGGAAMYNSTLTAYRALGNIRLEIASEIGSRAVVLVGGGLWVASGGGIIAVGVAYSSVGLAIGLIDYLIVRGKSAAGPIDHPFPSFSPRAAAPFALANTVSAIYQRIDNYLLALLRGTAAAGVYGAGYRFQDMIMILPVAL